MGRHASVTDGAAGRPGRELLGWGAFSVPVTVVLLVSLGGTWTLALLVGALALVVFATMWLVVTVSRPATAADERATTGRGRGSTP